MDAGDEDSGAGSGRHVNSLPHLPDLGTSLRPNGLKSSRTILSQECAVDVTLASLQQGDGVQNARYAAPGAIVAHDAEDRGQTEGHQRDVSFANL